MNISQASTHIAELIDLVDNAYWEAVNMSDKDKHHNLIQILSAEYIELMKISAQDHHYPYEVISISPQKLLDYLKDYQDQLMLTVARYKTHHQLSEQLDLLLNHYNK